MKSKTKVVVVGGGVVGVSALYHLAKKGWSDVVLVERKELTSGSTWHAAGLLPLFNMSYSVGQLHKYAVNLYKTLEEETGKNVGFSVVSNIRLASTKDRMDEYHQYAGVAKTIGVDVKFLTPQQVKEIWPLCHTDDLIGAIQHPEDGYIQPADLTQALAAGARNRGAEIYRNTAVTAIRQTKSGWVVETDKGSIECEHVISCSGNFARQTGEMVGLDIPVIPVEHQYIVTEPHPEIQKRKKDGLPEIIHTLSFLKVPQHNKQEHHLHMGQGLIHQLPLSYTICYHYLLIHPSLVDLLFFFFVSLDVVQSQYIDVQQV